MQTSSVISVILSKSSLAKKKVFNIFHILKFDLFIDVGLFHSTNFWSKRDRLLIRFHHDVNGFDIDLDYDNPMIWWTYRFCFHREIVEKIFWKYPSLRRSDILDHLIKNQKCLNEMFFFSKIVSSNTAAITKFISIDHFDFWSPSNESNHAIFSCRRDTEVINFVKEFIFTWLVRVMNIYIDTAVRMYYDEYIKWIILLIVVIKIESVFFSSFRDKKKYRLEVLIWHEVFILFA